MLSSNQIPKFQKKLLNWFRQFKRDLPWRRTHDPYRIWVSEIMLQQTRVTAAIPYYERFLTHFSTIQFLAEAPQEEVLRLWSGLGYYSRARNLQKAAQQIVAKHGGQFPENAVDVIELPGIGSYTAAAILSIAFGQRRAVLDGNVARVLARLGAVRGDLRETRRWRELQKSADTYLASTNPGDWNQAMMELGATVCTPKSPQCLLCPVAEFCKGRMLGIAETLPEKRVKRAAVKIILATAVLCDAKNRTILLPPPGKSKKKTDDDISSLVSHMWHFPMISVNKNPAAELVSFLTTNVGLRGKWKQELTEVRKVRHTVTYREITILPFLIRVKALPRVRGAKQTPLSEINRLMVSNLTRKVAQAVLAGAAAE
jgi:A/G-specific adenine glycosylase